ncbi:Meiotic nuclear division protein 1 [Penicillium odoratum]|uniref:Meiotic nuclear division protein 1 n=1 Tax=Penicillium odoratum TaxID=1167516 RepID=UPI002548364D|nr:Meiotic nuclear division protein 1 [Penicillium odoratum]KAJ5759057.1 Meiotic nuclear division protein 1 [Penicillium odoratum]
MPPKLSKDEKLALIVTHLQTRGTCYTFKELEKSLPGVASINSIQVKEYIQALTDENRIRVEKIGSGNWYWSFKSDEQVERERQLVRVQTEVEKAKKSCAEWEAALAAETKRRQDDSEESESENANGGINMRQKLLATKAELTTEVHRLRVAESGLGDSLCRKAVSTLKKELAGFRQQTFQWTDNLYVLEQHLRELAGGDREIVAAVLHECYGDEYVDGGLRELE